MARLWRLGVEVNATHGRNMVTLACTSPVSGLMTSSTDSNAPRRASSGTLSEDILKLETPCASSRVYQPLITISDEELQGGTLAPHFQTIAPVDLGVDAPVDLGLNFESSVITIIVILFPSTDVESLCALSISSTDYSYTDKLLIKSKGEFMPSADAGHSSGPLKSVAVANPPDNKQILDPYIFTSFSDIEDLNVRTQRSQSDKCQHPISSIGEALTQDVNPRSLTLLSITSSIKVGELFNCLRIPSLEELELKYELKGLDHFHELRSFVRRNLKKVLLLCQESLHPSIETMYPKQGFSPTHKYCFTLMLSKYGNMAEAAFFEGSKAGMVSHRSRSNIESDPWNRANDRSLEEGNDIKLCEGMVIERKSLKMTARPIEECLDISVAVSSGDMLN
ncbi:hypothetical protein B0H34DRAFT_825330 [Crassisporium funariophilum]|nr:hypothetical protein B0H34DRAFT_825330 [Crassisporium funariophilum]